MAPSTAVFRNCAGTADERPQQVSIDMTRVSLYVKLLLEVVISIVMKKIQRRQQIVVFIPLKCRNSPSTCVVFNLVSITSISTSVSLRRQDVVVFISFYLNEDEISRRIAVGFILKYCFHCCFILMTLSQCFRKVVLIIHSLVQVTSRRKAVGFNTTSTDAADELFVDCIF